MAEFVGPNIDRRELEVVYPDGPGAWEDGKPRRHARELDTSTTLCGVACGFMDLWTVETDAHPEDIPEDERCLRCDAIRAARDRRSLGQRKPRRPRRARLLMPIGGAEPKPSPKRIVRMVERRDAKVAELNRAIADEVRVVNDAGVPMAEIAAALGFSRQYLYKLLSQIDA